MFKHFSIALENEEEVVVPVQEEQTPAETPQERETREVDEAQAVVEDGFSQIDDAAQGTQDLGRIAERLEATEQVGGASPEVVAIAEVAVENIYRTLGIKRPVTALSVESFTNEKGRIKATRVAVESIKETVAEVWKKIKEFFAKIFKTVRDLFNKLFGIDKRNKQKAAELEKQIDGDEKIFSDEVVNEIQEELNKFVKNRNENDEVMNELNEQINKIIEENERAKSGRDIVAGMRLAASSWNFDKFHIELNKLISAAQVACVEKWFQNDTIAILEKFFKNSCELSGDFVYPIAKRDPRTKKVGIIVSHPYLTTERPSFYMEETSVEKYKVDTARYDHYVSRPQSVSAMTVQQVKEMLSDIRNSSMMSDLKKITDSLEKQLSDGNLEHGTTGKTDWLSPETDIQENARHLNYFMSFMITVGKMISRVTADQLNAVEDILKKES